MSRHYTLRRQRSSSGRIFLLMAVSAIVLALVWNFIGGGSLSTLILRGFLLFGAFSAVYSLIKYREAILETIVGLFFSSGKAVSAVAVIGFIALLALLWFFRWGAVFWIYVIGAVILLVINARLVWRASTTNLGTSFQLMREQMLYVGAFGGYGPGNNLSRVRLRAASTLQILSDIVAWPFQFGELVAAFYRGLHGGSMDQYVAEKSLKSPIRTIYLYMLVGVLTIYVLDGLGILVRDSFLSVLIFIPLVSVLLHFAITLLRPGHYIQMMRISEYNLLTNFITTSLIIFAVLVISLTLIGLWSGAIVQPEFAALEMGRRLLTFDIWNDVVRAGTVSPFDLLAALTGLLFSANILGIVLGGVFGEMKMTNEDLMIKSRYYLMLGNPDKMLATLQRVPEGERTIAFYTLYFNAHLSSGQIQRAFDIGKRLAQPERGETIDDVMTDALSSAPLYAKYLDLRHLRDLLLIWLQAGADDAKLATTIPSMYLEERMVKLLQTVNLSAEQTPLTYAAIEIVRQNYEAGIKILGDYSAQGNFATVVWNLLFSFAAADAPGKTPEPFGVYFNRAIELAPSLKNEPERMRALLFIYSVYRLGLTDAALRSKTERVLRALRKSISDDHPLLSSNLPMVDRSLAALPPA